MKKNEVLSLSFEFALDIIEFSELLDQNICNKLLSIQKLLSKIIYKTIKTKQL